MTAYYNEHDPHAAAWLRKLIERGNAIVPQVAAAFVMATNKTKEARVAAGKTC